uniref:Uncharacterized protein n=1 Tax=Strongyloides stercoralis TaxID=6248 RepID=A0A0K0EPV0_STRER
GIGAFLKET